MRALMVFACMALAGAPALARADAVSVLTAAHIHTMDPQRPDVQAIAWDASGKLIDVGDAKALLARHPGARHVDAGDATVLPGLIDAHGHVMDLGYSLIQADLTGTRDKAEIVSRLQAFARTLPKDAWLIGNGWDQNDWPDKAFPTAADLDAAFPDRPVWLRRVDGHAGWANHAALKRVGKDLSGDWQPDGGRIVRGDGQATGVLVDGAQDLVDAVVPAPDAATQAKALQLALQAMARVGLTGVHDMSTPAPVLALYKRFADEGRLTVRIDAYANGDAQALDDLCAHGPYQHPGGRLEMRGVKLFIDGALGSRGAALLADYSDDPGNRGILVTEPDVYARIVRKAHGCKLQVATHAIGDRGNRIVLDTYQQALGDDASGDHRWRVEHAQILSPQDIPRFARLHVIASMQPTHATSDMPWAQARLGKDRLAGAYAWRSLLDSGARLAFGSDFPVESPDPRLGLYAAVTRQDRDGQPPGGWYPKQRLTIAEAVREFTSDAAWAGRDEGKVGKLAPGLRADFVVFGADPMTVAPAALQTLPIRSTWLDGKPVYEAKPD